MMQIGTPPLGGVFDLGCGDWAALGGLKAWFPKRRIVGVDSSAALLAKARGYDALLQADIADWQPDEPVAEIFSNAVLQWLGNHGGVLARLAGLLWPGALWPCRCQANQTRHRIS
jgi:trans-aconitate 2-methyltransferase